MIYFSHYRDPQVDTKKAISHSDDNSKTTKNFYLYFYTYYLYNIFYLFIYVAASYLYL